MKPVSIIVPCHNAVKWLPRCFLSLVGQTIGIGQMELIFVDDASDDDGQTWAMLQEFERAYPQSIMILHLEQNMRQGGARNAALPYATGAYLAFVDADDFVADDYCERIYKKAVESDADIVQFEYDLYTERLGAFASGRNVLEEILTVVSVEDRKRLLLSEKITYGCWNKWYRTDMVRDAGVQYAEHVIYEEPLFVYPLLYAGSRFVVMPDRLYYYRQNDAGTMWKDMKSIETLQMHAQVQYAVWNFMKQRQSDFDVYYEEIKLYFLHTFFYETLLFAVQRRFEVSMEWYQKLEAVVKQEVPDYWESAYEKQIPVQMELYRMARQGMDVDMLDDFLRKIMQ